MVFASTEEGFGTAVIEAMAHGLPVVARRLPGVNDVFVDEGRSGYFFESGGDYLRYVVGSLADRSLSEPDWRSGQGIRCEALCDRADRRALSCHLWRRASPFLYAPRGAEEGGSRLASSHVTSD